MCFLHKREKENLKILTSIIPHYYTSVLNIPFEKTHFSQMESRTKLYNLLANSNKRRNELINKTFTI